MAKILKKPVKSRIPGSPGGGFTSTPRAGAPRFPPGVRDGKAVQAPLLEGRPAWEGTRLSGNSVF